MRSRKLKPDVDANDTSRRFNEAGSVRSRKRGAGESDRRARTTTLQ